MSIFKRNTTLSVIALALFICLSSLAFSSASDASPQPSNEVYFHGVVDYEDLRARDSLYAATKLASSDAEYPRTVRLVYYLPKDRPFRQEVVDSMKVAIRQVQAFFAQEMQRHGHGNLTFRFETDLEGGPLVHRIDGDLEESEHRSYLSGLPDAEWSRYQRQITVAVFDFSYNPLTSQYGTPAGVARVVRSPAGDYIISGRAELPSSFHWKTIAHELGHTFGLEHDHRDGSYIMSYGYQSPHQLSACAAGFLSIHPYFNPAMERPQEASSWTFERISPARYPLGSESVTVSLKISNPDGLHQVFLYVYSPVYVSEFILKGSMELAACRYLSGERSAVVEFDYNGRAPSNSNVIPLPSLANATSHQIGVWAVDTSGRIGRFGAAVFQASDRHIATLDTIAGHSLAFSPNGAALAYTQIRTSMAYLRDLKTGKITASFGPASPPFFAIAISPDGAMLASEHRGKVKLWDVATGANTATFEGRRPHLTGPGAASVAFSPPDGAVLAVRNGSPSVKLWNLSTGDNYADLEHDGDTEVYAMAFSPTGTRLVTGSGDGMVKLWDVATGNLVETLERVPGWVGGVAYSPDGTTLAIRDGYSGTIKLFDVKTWRSVATIDYAAGRIGYSGRYIAFSPDGATLAFAVHRSLILWDVETLAQIDSLAHESDVVAIAFSPDGKTLASGSNNAGFNLWDVSDRVTPVVNIPDANLRAVIQSTLGKPRFAPITREDLASLTTLDASNRNIRELDGLEFATNLTELNIEGNPLSSSAITTHVPALQERGVAVLFDDKPTATPDFSGDGAVDIADFLLFVAQFGFSEDDEEYEARYDLDGDGEIGIGDFLIFVNAFGNSGS